MALTTIQINSDLRDRIKMKARKCESYAQFLERILDEREKLKGHE